MSSRTSVQSQLKRSYVALQSAVLMMVQAKEIRKCLGLDNSVVVICNIGGDVLGMKRL